MSTSPSSASAGTWASARRRPSDGSGTVRWVARLTHVGQHTGRSLFRKNRSITIFQSHAPAAGKTRKMSSLLGGRPDHDHDPPLTCPARPQVAAEAAVGRPIGRRDFAAQKASPGRPRLVLCHRPPELNRWDAEPDVTAEQTRSTLLSAAGHLCGEEGYDGARHFGHLYRRQPDQRGAVHHYSSAELFVAVLEAHGQRQFQDLVSGAGMSPASWRPLGAPTVGARPTHHS